MLIMHLAEAESATDPHSPHQRPATSATTGHNAPVRLSSRTKTLERSLLSLEPLAPFYGPLVKLQRVIGSASYPAL